METTLTNKTVTKSNQLIEARYKLDPIPQKLVLIFIALINPQEHNGRNYYRISFRELYETLGLQKTGNRKEHLIKTFLKLKNPIWLTPNLMANWFSSVEFLDNGMIEIEFSNKLTEHLFQLKKDFKTYKLYPVLKLKSRYSIRFYELCKRHEYKKGFELEVDELKIILGVKAGRYTRYNDFIKYVVAIAQDELYHKTDIGFSYKEIKAIGSKKIQSLRFRIFETKKEGLPKQLADLKNQAEQKLHTQAVATRTPFEIPANSKNTRRFDIVYKNFMDCRQNYPDEYTFNNYIEDGGTFQIIQLHTGGLDLKPLQMQTKII